MKIAALGGSPVLLLVVAAVVLACQAVLSYTTFGRHMVAVGCNERAARNVGIDVHRVRTLALVTTSIRLRDSRDRLGDYAWIGHYARAEWL